MATPEEELEVFKAKTSVWKENVKGKMQQLENQKEEYREEAERHLGAIEGYKEMIKSFQEEMLAKEAEAAKQAARADSDADEKVAFYKEYVAKMDEVLQERDAQIRTLRGGGNPLDSPSSAAGGGDDAAAEPTLETEQASHARTVALFELERREHALTSENLARQIERLKREASGAHPTPPSSQAEEYYSENLKLKNELQAMERHMLEQQSLYRELAIKEGHLTELHAAAQQEARDKEARIDLLREKAREKLAEKDEEIEELQERHEKFRLLFKEKYQGSEERGDALQLQLDALKEAMVAGTDGGGGGGGGGDEAATAALRVELEEARRAAEEKGAELDALVEKQVAFKEMVKERFDGLNAKVAGLEADVAARDERLQEAEAAAAAAAAAAALPPQHPAAPPSGHASTSASASLAAGGSWDASVAEFGVGGGGGGGGGGGAVAAALRAVTENLMCRALPAAASQPLPSSEVRAAVQQALL
eukprot:Rhum_TRINITY_DN14382_c12_g1::Rhum_TRINITY_DN14382_c12_g1_i1::g.85351::m.85351